MYLISEFGINKSKDGNESSDPAVETPTTAVTETPTPAAVEAPTPAVTETPTPAAVEAPTPVEAPTSAHFSS